MMVRDFGYLVHFEFLRHHSHYRYGVLTNAEWLDFRFVPEQIRERKILNAGLIHIDLPFKLPSKEKKMSVTNTNHTAHWDE